MKITIPGYAQPWCQQETGERRRHDEDNPNQPEIQIDKEWSVFVCRSFFYQYEKICREMARD